MAILTFTGFEDGATALTGDHNAGTGSGAGVTFDTGTVRTGTYSLRSNCTTTETASMQLGLLSADGRNIGASFDVATIYNQFYFRYATKPASNSEIFFNADTDQNAYLQLNSSGNIEVYGGAGGATLIATGATVLSSNTWYQIRFNATAGVGGAYNLYIDGVSELSGTGDFGTGTNWSQVAFGKILDLHGQSVDFFFDDVVIDGATYPAGAAEVKAIIPTANGSTMSWTSGTGSSDYQEVDELPFSDSEYVQCPTTGNPNIALFAMQDCTTVGITGTILAVKATARARENTSVTSASLIRIYSSGATTDSSTFNGSTSVVPRGWLALTDPNTSAAWTTSGVDGVQMGMVENNAVADRCTQVLGMVCYIPGGASTNSNFLAFM